jgi:hypothetical protein
MEQVRTSRKSAAAVTINTNVRCERIYPTEETKKAASDLQTVGIRLSREQAIHLARVLLAVTQDWEHVDVTAYRFEKRKDDDTYRLTVTSRIDMESGD